MGRWDRFASERTFEPQEPPPGIYESRYDPVLAAGLCRRLRAGESLRSICRDPEMPSEKTVWNWARRYPEFAAMKAHAQTKARAEALARQAERDAAQASAKAARRRAKGWKPVKTGYGEAMVHAICVRLMMGESLTAICRDPGMPCVGTVYYWLRAHPEFVEEYRRARKMQGWTLRERACRVIDGQGAGRMRRTARAVRRVDREAAWLTPKRYAPPKGPAEVVVVRPTPDGAGELLYGEPALFVPNRPAAR